MLQARGAVHYQYQKKHQYYKCIYQFQNDKKSQGETKTNNNNNKKGGGGGGGRSTSTVNAYIHMCAFHTHSNNHKYCKIMHISISTWQSEKAQNKTVNTYINTKAFHTQPPTITLQMCRNIRIKFLSWAYMYTTLTFFRQTCDSNKSIQI